MAYRLAASVSGCDETCLCCIRKISAMDEGNLATLNKKHTSRVLVIYTGGTIGMKKDPKQGYVVVPNYFASALKSLPMLYDKEYAENPKPGKEKEKLPESYALFPELVMPISNYGMRIFYYVKELEPILDSSNMSMVNWTDIASDIQTYYKDFDAFVILHGTDTLAYTASALSFMLENLGKTVILTGAQIPIFEQRNDARSNFIGALVIAGHYIIPEVSIYFSHKLLRGNRSMKYSTSDLDAFHSPNLPPLVKMGVDIEVTWDAIFRSYQIAKFTVHKKMNPNVGLLRLFPGINADIVKAFFQPPMQGVVVETFGAGNVPSNRPDLINEFKEAADRGIILLNITQCLKGSVRDAYAAGRAFFDIGVLPGFDMTPEAALTKMAYVLSKENLTLSERKRLLCTNIRGEMAVDFECGQFTIKDGEFIRTVATSLKVGSQKLFEREVKSYQTTVACFGKTSRVVTTTVQEMQHVRRALLPVLLCCAAKSGDLKAIIELLDQGADINAPSDYDGKSVLHIACAEGKIDMVRFLLENGASVYMKDRRGRMPLFDAIRNRHGCVVDLMVKTGAHFPPDDPEVSRELCIAAGSNDLECIKLWHRANVDMNCTDLDGRTPLHVAVMRERYDMMRYLVSEVGVQIDKKDIFGNTPYDNARRLKLKEAIEIFKKFCPKTD